jgi:hypothetical protein
VPVDDYYCQIDLLTGSALSGCGLIGGIGGSSGVIIAARSAFGLDLESVLV